MQFLSHTNYNFIRWRWHAIVLSLLVILAGVGAIWQSGMPMGVDFKGGTILVFKFDNAVSEDKVRSALDSMPGDKTVQKYGSSSANEIMVRLPETREAEQGNSLERDVRAATAAITGANLGKFEIINTEVVGPVVGAELQRKGIYATLFSILGLTVYIAFRFRFSFALGAIAATFHDILVTFVFLKFFGYELSLNIVAAILTIVGYSVNDTIVIFDRVRENTRFMRKESLEQVVNIAVNQTLSRTIITAGTTFLAVLALYIFGGEVLRGFSFTMLVGIISGTYSTIFIAAAIAIILSRKKEPAKAVAVAASEAAANGNGAGRKKSAKKAR
jgi:preprotein translocase subunit SecF